MITRRTPGAPCCRCGRPPVSSEPPPILVKCCPDPVPEVLDFAVTRTGWTGSGQLVAYGPGDPLYDAAFDVHSPLVGWAADFGTPDGAVLWAWYGPLQSIGFGKWLGECFALPGNPCVDQGSPPGSTTFIDTWAIIWLGCTDLSGWQLSVDLLNQVFVFNRLVGVPVPLPRPTVSFPCCPESFPDDELLIRRLRAPFSRLSSPAPTCSPWAATFRMTNPSLAASTYLSNMDIAVSETSP